MAAATPTTVSADEHSSVAPKPRRCAPPRQCAGVGESEFRARQLTHHFDERMIHPKVNPQTAVTTRLGSSKPRRAAAKAPFKARHRPSRAEPLGPTSDACSTRGQTMRTHNHARGVPGGLPVLIVALPLLLAGCGDASVAPTSTENMQETESPRDEGHRSDGADDSGLDEPTNSPSAPKESAEPDGPAEPKGPVRPNESDKPTVPSSPGSPRQEDPKPVYEWSLPKSDTSVGGNYGEFHPFGEGGAYATLREGCSGGERILNSRSYLSLNVALDRFENPRNVLLYAAAVQLCQGDREAATKFFEQAQIQGFEGLAPQTWCFCDLYKQIRSVLEQRPPGDFTCAGGTAPQFKVGENGVVDDPLTMDLDESLTENQTGPVPEPEPTPEPTAEAPTAPAL